MKLPLYCKILLILLSLVPQVMNANNNVAYLYMTSDAEDAIIRGDYVTALAIYKKAFEKKGGKFFC